MKGYYPLQKPSAMLYKIILTENYTRFKLLIINLQTVK